MLVNHGGPDDLTAEVDELWATRLLPFEQNTRLGGALRGAARSWWTRSRTGPTTAGGWPPGCRTRPAVRRVDHIGSTAIPGMAAKNVIDLQLTVPDLRDRR